MSRPSRAQLTADIIDDVSALARPYVHTEIGAERTSYTTTNPSLIAQVHLAALYATAPDTNGPRKPAGSKPPLDVELLALIVDIRLQGIAVVHLATPRPRLRPTPAANLRYAVAHPHRYSDEALPQVASIVGQLRHRAEVALSWIRAPYHLRGNCPHCAAPGGLLVHLDDHGPTDAVCTHCGATWAAGQLGILARHLGLEAPPQTGPNAPTTVVGLAPNLTVVPS